MLVMVMMMVMAVLMISLQHQPLFHTLRNRRGSMREILAASALRKELWVAMDLQWGIS